MATATASNTTKSVTINLDSADMARLHDEAEANVRRPCDQAKFYILNAIRALEVAAPDGGPDED